ncbi:protein kinase domain-containing protein [Toxoplasma gondii TgCatPRC2]|uniref:non-specific serine/threonine protein kinase n=1 Tax=Toxoplasma gondii TgCatPRC2 TaxID=1130821 RepID=A0A151H2A8_TOXGO|nr:protein kinase domain-containing protein [Toxoplasma gondii TgCatPRC2]
MDLSGFSNLQEILRRVSPAHADSESSPSCLIQLSELAAQTWTAELVAALEWLRERGVVHRDLKPQNLVISPEGHLCVVDFGAALLFPAEDQTLQESRELPEKKRETNSRLGSGGTLSPSSLSSVGPDALMTSADGASPPLLPSPHRSAAGLSASHCSLPASASRSSSVPAPSRGVSVSSPVQSSSPSAPPSSPGPPSSPSPLPPFPPTAFLSSSPSSSSHAPSSPSPSCLAASNASPAAGGSRSTQSPLSSSSSLGVSSELLNGAEGFMLAPQERQTHAQNVREKETTPEKGEGETERKQRPASLAEAANPQAQRGASTVISDCAGTCLYSAPECFVQSVAPGGRAGIKESHTSNHFQEKTLDSKIPEDSRDGKESRGLGLQSAASPSTEKPTFTTDRLPAAHVTPGSSCASLLASQSSFLSRPPSSSSASSFSTSSPSSSFPSSSSPSASSPSASSPSSSSPQLSSSSSASSSWAPSIHYALDLWSLGCIAYEMLCGRPAFEAQVPQETVEKILRGAVEFPSSLSAEARDFISRLLVVEPTERLGFRDFSELKFHPFLASLGEDFWRLPSVPLVRLYERKRLRTLRGAEKANSREAKREPESESAREADALREATASNAGQSSNGDASRDSDCFFRRSGDEEKEASGAKVPDEGPSEGDASSQLSLVFSQKKEMSTSRPRSGFSSASVAPVPPLEALGENGQRLGDLPPHVSFSELQESEDDIRFGQLAAQSSGRCSEFLPSIPTLYNADEEGNGDIEASLELTPFLGFGASSLRRAAAGQAPAAAPLPVPCLAHAAVLASPRSEETHAESGRRDVECARSPPTAWRHTGRHMQFFPEESIVRDSNRQEGGSGKGRREANGGPRGKRERKEEEEEARGRRASEERRRRTTTRNEGREEEEARGRRASEERRRRTTTRNEGREEEEARGRRASEERRRRTTTRNEGRGEEETRGVVRKGRRGSPSVDRRVRQVSDEGEDFVGGDIGKETARETRTRRRSNENIENRMHAARSETRGKGEKEAGSRTGSRDRASQSWTAEEDRRLSLARKKYEGDRWRRSEEDLGIVQRLEDRSREDNVGASSLSDPALGLVADLYPLGVLRAFLDERETAVLWGPLTRMQEATAPFNRFCAIHMRRRGYRLYGNSRAALEPEPCLAVLTDKPRLLLFDPFKLRLRKSILLSGDGLAVSAEGGDVLFYQSSRYSLLFMDDRGQAEVWAEIMSRLILLRGRCPSEMPHIRQFFSWCPHCFSRPSRPRRGASSVASFGREESEAVIPPRERAEASTEGRERFTGVENRHFEEEAVGMGAKREGQRRLSPLSLSAQRSDSQKEREEQQRVAEERDRWPGYTDASETQEDEEGRDQENPWPQLSHRHLSSDTQEARERRACWLLKRRCSSIERSTTAWGDEEQIAEEWEPFSDDGKRESGFEEESENGKRRPEVKNGTQMFWGDSEASPKPSSFSQFLLGRAKKVGNVAAGAVRAFHRKWRSDSDSEFRAR